MLCNGISVAPSCGNFQCEGAWGKAALVCEGPMTLGLGLVQRQSKKASLSLIIVPEIAAKSLEPTVAGAGVDFEVC